MSAQIDRDKIVEDLGQVFDFLHSIDDPYADSVAVAAGIISGEIGEAPAAARLLSLGEVREWKERLWLEARDGFEIAADSPHVTRAIVDGFECGGVIFYISPNDGIPFDCDAILYGEKWRCWETRPTEEEMAAAPWEDNDVD